MKAADHFDCKAFFSFWGGTRDNAVHIEHSASEIKRLQSL